MKKKAMIFGVTGQDGAYLSKLLIQKGYIVHGVKRKSSSHNTSRIDEIFYENLNKKKQNFILHYGDVTDGLSISNLIRKIKPNEIYNLAAQSHVKVSFELPEYTANTDGLSVLRILEVIRGLKHKCKFYQAGTSEMFGDVLEKPQTEKTPFNPMSPYAASKVFAYWITTVYRKSYNIFASNGILFNHESPLRGDTFVTKKIINSLIKIKLGKQSKLLIGNIYSKRDWGHAKDYVEAMWKILQHSKPDDFVIATNKEYSVKYFINFVAKKLNMKINWVGEGINEKAFWNDKCIIKCDKKYFRPLEVDSLRGDYSKARKLLNWKPKYDLNQLVDEMIHYEKKLIISDK
jgi:GDPmannose 4,6-dehydratase